MNLGKALNSTPVASLLRGGMSVPLIVVTVVLVTVVVLVIVVAVVVVVVTVRWWWWSRLLHISGDGCCGCGDKLHRPTKQVRLGPPAAGVLRSALALFI